mgnify:FL=1
MTSLAALCALAALAGCAEARRVIADYPVAERPETADAPYPSLVDMPSPRAARATAPDPADGAGAVGALRAEAAVMAAEAERLSAPVTEIEALRASGAAARAGRR